VSLWCAGAAQCNESNFHTLFEAFMVIDSFFVGEHGMIAITHYQRLLI
jgi:hypothetical protein